MKVKYRFFGNIKKNIVTIEQLGDKGQRQKGMSSVRTDNYMNVNLRY